MMLKLKAITIKVILLNTFLIVTSKTALNVKILTFNINGKEPIKNINDILEVDQYSNVDLYAIGLQEVNPLISLTKTNEYLWTKSLDEYFRYINFELIATSKIQTTFMLVFAKKDLSKFITSINIGTINTGVGGIGGNKGGTAVRFIYSDKSFCLVNSHLAAHEEKLDDRIENYYKIYEKLIFEQNLSKKINDHDVIFWFGDLNFRLQGITFEQVVQEVNSRKAIESIASDLIKYDQLKKVIITRKAFLDFSEPLIKFFPTFKFTINENNYNPKRVPSYTDRILYKINNKSIKVTNLYYKSISKFQFSDHRPVTAAYSIEM